ncbi:PucR family transcriptional regulator ligand-binding domain-containing protein [Bacillus sp. JCM 19041]|uniref:PucR family transcriptional regulator ligand-binding domain-containing protein n=1 Tax=Bacillus sp. JCM 19041 TaxID=1460637 RepID=UPI0006CFA24A
MIGAELLRLTEQEYGIKCVAGEKGLQQEIRYVSVQELPLKSNRFSKNGLVLSTFSSFESNDEIVNHLHWYHSKHVAAIGFHLAVQSSIPKEIKRTATQLNLPLLSIPSHVPYHVLFDIIYKQLHREDHSMILDVDYINQEILRILIEKEDLLSMIDEIGRLAQIRIFITDPMFKLTAASKLIREQSLDWQRVLDQHLDVTQLDYQQLLAEGRHFSIHRLDPSDGYVFIEEMPLPSVHQHSYLTRYERVFSWYTNNKITDTL